MISVKLFDDAISGPRINDLVKEAEQFWKLAGGNRNSAKSYWVDATTKVEDTRCYLEQFSLEIAKYHFKGKAYDSVKGVEFWVQIREGFDDTTSGLDFHFDKDEHALEEWGIWSHPALSSATYLESFGAPLVIFDTESEMGIEEEEEEEEDDDDDDDDNDDDDDDDDDDSSRSITSSSSSSSNEKDRDECIRREEKVEKANRVSERNGVAEITPSRGYVVGPIKGRHICFPGNFLHGIPAELFNGEHKNMNSSKSTKKRKCHFTQNNRRVSILVNVWVCHQPEEVLIMPSSVIESITISKDVSRKGEDFCLDVESIQEIELECVRVSETQDEKKNNAIMLNSHVQSQTGCLPIEIKEKGWLEGKRNAIEIVYY